MLFIPDFSREIAPFNSGLIYAQLPFPANAQGLLLYWIRRQDTIWLGAALLSPTIFVGRLAFGVSCS